MSDNEEVKKDVETNAEEVDLNPSLTFNFNHRIVPNGVVAAVIEPNGAEVLVAVTASNKVIVKDSDVSLNIEETIRCICAGRFEKNYDYIILGTESNIICFDVHDNHTLFKRDVPDGVNCLAFGKIGALPLMVYCGGNCAIWGFDVNGNNNYWTVTGDVVSTMCICDYDNDGEQELIIGSPDYEIRIFKNDLMRAELTETDAIVFLASVGVDCFAYALANGTIGVYQREQRLWRIKSKNNVVSMVHFPSINTMTCAWKMGKIDVRMVDNGEVSFRDQTLNSQVVAACLWNFQGVQSLVVALGDGKIQTFEIGKRREVVDKTQEIIREFGQKKHNLMMELSNYEQEENLTDAERDRQDRIPMDTQLVCVYVVNDDTLNLLLTANNNVCIRAVIIFSEGLFDGESFIWVPNKIEGDGDKATVKILPDKDVSNDLHIKALLGHVDSQKVHVFEVFRPIPRFARFALASKAGWVRPTCYVEFELKARIQRVFDWVHQCFVVDANSADFEKETNELELQFVGLAPRKDEHLAIKYSRAENKLTFFHDDIETSGNFVQSLASFLQLQSLNTVASYPTVFAEAEEIISTIDTMSEVRNQLVAEQQERQSAVKETIVRAEDAVAINNLTMARKLYIRLKQMDSAARQSALLRANNQERCAQTLRRLNKIIEYASKLRYGDTAREVVSLCRSAIADDNKQVIIKVMQFGAAE